MEKTCDKARQLINTCHFAHRLDNELGRIVHANYYSGRSRDIGASAYTGKALSNNSISSVSPHRGLTDREVTFYINF